MQVFFTNIIAVAFVLGIMVLIHEFGHYAIAKWCGVRVETFSIGFGKRLFGFRRGETDYRISVLPLGGYVKMSGENPMEESTGDPGEFMSHPRWQRFLIAIAGPAMNILFAVAVLTIVYMVHYARPYYLDEPAVIGHVFENTPAAKAGIQAGDRIVRIDGIDNPTWQDVIPKVLISPNQPLEVVVQHGAELQHKTLTPAGIGTESYGEAGWSPDQPRTVTYVDSGNAADKAGIRVGDDLLALNGVPIESIPHMIALLQENKEKPLVITVRRNQQEFKATVIPFFDAAEGQKKFRIGIVSEPERVDKLPFRAALARSIDVNKKNSLLIIELVQKMVRRKISVKQMDGPIGIARISGDAARQSGWTPLLTIMSAISLNLGIFNLLPIPILDGGVILLLLIEGLMRRDINQHFKERLYQAAFVFLLLFAAMVILNDIAKIPGLGRYLP